MDLFGPFYLCIEEYTIVISLWAIVITFWSDRSSQYPLKVVQSILAIIEQNSATNAGAALFGRKLNIILVNFSENETQGKLSKGLLFSSILP